MKRFRLAAFVVAALGCAAYQGREMVIYAAAPAVQNVPGAQDNGPVSTHPDDKQGGEEYAKHCAICHGDQREGILPGFPPLLGISRQLKEQQVTQIIRNGRGRMPAFPKLREQDVTALVHFLSTSPTTSSAGNTEQASGAHPSALAEAGGGLFQQNCAFCHGRDAAGGETGPDLTRSKLVKADKGGDLISEVVRNGRPEKKMPAFNFSETEMAGLTAFIHGQETKAASAKGARRGVDVADLQTGNVDAGKRYFEGAGTCSTCHSVSGDLSGIAKKYEGLQLEQRMLYPKDVKSKVTVTLPSGETVTGKLAYRDEFTVGLRDAEDVYHSWPVSRVKYAVDAPVNAHVELFSKYTDADIHNLMAYLQTLR